MKFDVVIGNPPYQDSQNATGKRGGGSSLWDKFVGLALDLVKDDGFVCMVHPALWRKPNTDRCWTAGLLDRMVKENHLRYLEIHDSKDGLSTFGAGTRYDWYVIQKGSKGETEIVDEKGKYFNQDLSNVPFVPNCAFDAVFSLIVHDAEKKQEILFSNSSYETRKKWMNTEQSEEYPYVCIHSTPKAGVRYMYSSCNNNEFFGIPKVIFGDSGIYNPVIDLEGQYGMTQHAMAIPVDSLEDAEKLCKFLTSEQFKAILEACSWSNFQIDWRMFTHFKEGFWR